MIKIGSNDTGGINLGSQFNLSEHYKTIIKENEKARHTHDNAEALSSITQEMIDKWNSADYGKANSLSYFYANNLNNSLYGQIDTSGALVADYIFKNNSMTDITVDLSSCVSLIGGFLNSEVESLTFENGTPKLTKANSLLNGCKKLKSVRGLDLSNTTDIKYLCKDCESLTDEMYIGSPATDISYILYNCKKLTSVGLNCENVTNATGAFTGCYSLTNLRLYGMTVSFDVSDTAITEGDELVEWLGETDGGVITFADGATISFINSNYEYFLSKGWTIAGDVNLVIHGTGAIPFEPSTGDSGTLLPDPFDTTVG